MANSNGRIYIDTSTTPHKGVEIADLQNVLGTARNDIGQIIVNEDINKWAKYRPIEKADFKGILTDAMRRAENWGIGNIPVWSSETLANAANFWAKNNGVAPDCGLKTAYWTRVLPSTWYRLLDFASTEHAGKGYWHDAEAPISQFVGGLAIPPTNQLDVIYLRGAEADETILLSEIGSFDDYYFGVMFVEENGTNIYIFTQDYQMGSASWSQDFTVHIANAKASLVPSGTSKNWYVFPVLCGNSFTTLTEVHSDLTARTVVALLPATLESISAQGIDYTFLSNGATLNGRTVSASFYFKNNETGTGLQGVRVTLEYKTALGVVLYTQQVYVQCTGQNPGVVPADSYGYADGSHAFNSTSEAASIYSVVAHVDQITGNDYTVEWAEAVVCDLPRY